MFAFVCAKGVWIFFGVFFTLDHEERWRASINFSSYQWALGRSNQDGFVPLCVSLCRCYHFSLCRALLCLQSFPLSPPLCLWFLACRSVTVCDDIQWTANHCNISGTDECHSDSNPPCCRHTQLHEYMLSCLVFIGTAHNKQSQALSRQPHTFHNDAPEHEKGWSSRSSNRVE